MDTNQPALATVPAGSAALARGASTARDLADASISVNTRLAYRSALAGFDGSGAPETDDGIASYLGQLFDAGRAASSAAMVVAAIRFRARLAGRPSPTGPAVDRALVGFRRQAQGRGRGQAPPMLADDLAAIAATARQPRRSRNGRGVESAAGAGSNSRRLQAAAVAAGVEHRLTGHSGRVGLASELTARGASTADVMLAGGWKTSRMVAHYAAGATAERGAVARYL